jgi:hypothetical protein
MSIYFITFATDKNKVKILESSCKTNNVPLIILGLNDKWEGFGTKFIKIKEFLENSPEIDNEDIIFYNDGYDTICQADFDYIRKKFESIYQPGKIIVSAEVYLWPPPIFSHKNYFDELNKGKYRYPCSGQYAGTKIDLLNMFNTLNMKPNEDDQEAVVKYTVNFPFKVQLDYNCDLFQPNLFLLENEKSHYDANEAEKKFNPNLNDDLSFNKIDNKIVIQNLYTNSIPCFIHANGPSKDYIINWYNHYIKPLKKAALSPKRLPPAYVIVMPNRVDYVKNTFTTHRIPYQEFEAVKGKNFSYQQLFEDGIISRPSIELTLGEIGCYMSHASVLEKLKEPGVDKICIFEDDIRIPNYLPGKWIGDQILEAIKKVPSDCDVLYLGRCYDNCDMAEPVNDMILKVYNPLCLHAYIVFKKALNKLRDIYPITDAVDRYYVNKIKEGKIKAYATNPPLFMQNNYLRSNVQKKEINYTPVCTEDHSKIFVNTSFVKPQNKLDTDPVEMDKYLNQFMIIDEEKKIMINTKPDNSLNWGFIFFIIFILILIYLFWKFYGNNFKGKQRFKYFY